MVQKRKETETKRHMTSTSLLASILHVKLRVGCKLPVQIKFKVRITAAGTSSLGLGLGLGLGYLYWWCVLHRRDCSSSSSSREKSAQQLRVSYEPVRTSYADQDQIAATHAGVSAMLLAKQVEVKGNSGAGNSALSHPVCSEDCAYYLILRLSLSRSSQQSALWGENQGSRHGGEGGERPANSRGQTRQLPLPLLLPRHFCWA